MDSIRYFHRSTGLRFRLGAPGDVVQLGELSIAGPVLVTWLLTFAAIVETGQRAQLARRPLARVELRPTVKLRPARRLRGADGRRLRGL